MSAGVRKDKEFCYQGIYKYEPNTQYCIVYMTIKVHGQKLTATVADIPEGHCVYLHSHQHQACGHTLKGFADYSAHTHTHTQLSFFLNQNTLHKFICRKVR